MAATTHVCTRCARISPTDAVYCYFDGAVLEGYGTRGGGPVNIGAQPFPAPFVFPTGQRCLNFDQLALTCQKNWQAALDVRAQGYLESSWAAWAAASGRAAGCRPLPDRDRGLTSSWRSSLGGRSRRCGVEPTEVTLAAQPRGGSRVELRLEKQGHASHLRLRHQ